ncbi:MAG: helical backbone metal receptor, partial [Candidatus Krumholzibacteria bacterium]|nr:helical backbone metal receptor [Candidatus Krumholzibacteria bacterium]
MFPLRIYAAAAILSAAMSLSCDNKGGDGTERNAPEGMPAGYRRVVSLSPSTTEILFMLGLGEKVVGVTRFCSIPAGSREITRVGGYLDPGYEAIAGLEPDIVFLLPEQEKTAGYLDVLGVNSVTVDNKTISDIISAIDTIGVLFGVETRSDSLEASIISRMNRIRESIPRTAPRPRVLVSVGHSFGRGLGEVSIAGRGTYYSEILEAAGAENACAVGMIKYPVLSAEGIISIDPDIIMELVPPGASPGMDADLIAEEWMSLVSVKAVR